jgi:predicted transcriptional regulator
MTQRAKWPTQRRVLLDDDLASYVSAAADREGLSESAIIRQAIALRRLTEARRAQIDAEMFAQEEGIS